MKSILSICIATYNRKKELIELVNCILDSPNDEFLLEITDDSSSDGTIEALAQINDSRLLVHKNKKNIQTTKNVINCILNCKSKYALYLNDRELFDSADLPKLIDYLKVEEPAFVWLVEGRRSIEANYFEVKEQYNSGVDALLHAEFAHHPSGMVFNTKIICEELSEYISQYMNWESMHSWSVVAFDLCTKGKYAVIKSNLWKERGAVYLGSIVSKSDTTALRASDKCWFSYKSIIKEMSLMVEHAMNIADKLNYDWEIKAELLYVIIIYFYGMLPWIKYYLQDIFQCRHYMIKKRRVFYYEMLKWRREYYKEVLNVSKQYDLYDIINNKIKSQIITKNSKISVWIYMKQLMKKDLTCYRDARIYRKIKKGDIKKL